MPAGQVRRSLAQLGPAIAAPAFPLSINSHTHVNIAADAATATNIRAQEGGEGGKARPT